MEHVLLSGFADEIASDFNRQIQVLNRLAWAIWRFGAWTSGDRHLLRDGGTGGKAAP